MSSFSPILNTALALGLGITGTLALQSSTAVGYPSEAISSGHNPVVSMGATVLGDGSLTVLEAAADQDIVVTDIVLSVTDTNPDCSVAYIATFTRGDGSILATVSAGLGRNDWGSGYLPVVPVSLASGIRVPAGDTLTMTTNRTMRYGCGTDRLMVTASGYLAAP